MDLQTRVGTLKIQGYTGSIKLQQVLSIDVLIMSSGTITRDPNWNDQGVLQHLVVRQDIANTFGASSWTGGTIGDGDRFTFRLIGDSEHPLTFTVSDATSTPTFSGVEWLIGTTRAQVPYTTVNWNSGNINMGRTAAGSAGQITNWGMFVARSTGKITSNNANKKWKFYNEGDLTLRGDETFEYCTLVARKQGTIYKKASLDTGSPGTFTVLGEVVQEGGLVSVESGTFAVNGTYAQSDDEVVLSAGTTLSVSDSYTLNGGSVTVNGDANGTTATLDVGSYTQSGGTLSINYGTLEADHDVTLTGGTATLLYVGGSIGEHMQVSGGTFALYNLTDFIVAAGVQVSSGGTLELHSGTLVGDVTNAGVLHIGPGSGSAGDDYTINGNFTQTSTGRLIMEVNSSTHDHLSVSGTATLNGVFQLTLLDGYMPYPGANWEFLSYGSRSGTFASYDLPTLQMYGSWDPRYDDPDYPDAFSLWVVE